MLTPEQINEYHGTGVLVVENVLTDQEIDTARALFHDQLLSMGIDHDKVLTGEQTIDDGVRIKGKASKIFYNKWKLDVHLHQKVYDSMMQLMAATYFSGKTKGYEHPFGPSDDLVAYIDRVCWRLPDAVKAEGGLVLHLDRNPVDPWLKDAGGLKKWRPIQAFVTLTDHYIPNNGGLRVVKGFHRHIDEYFAKSHIQSGEGGEFFRMNSKSYVSLERELETIYAPKGSLICWDNRLPHATCDKLDGWDTREVVYVGLLPNIKLNQEYCKQQLQHIRGNLPPPAYFDNNKTELSDRNWEEKDLSELQKYMLGFGL